VASAGRPLLFTPPPTLVKLAFPPPLRKGKGAFVALSHAWLRTKVRRIGPLTPVNGGTRKEPKPFALHACVIAENAPFPFRRGRGKSEGNEDGGWGAKARTSGD
jgi:hypothetical protein